MMRYHGAKGWQEILAYVLDNKKKVPVLKEIPVVKDFPNVFPEELPGLLPDREIEFGINVPQLFKKGTIGWKKFDDEFS